VDVKKTARWALTLSDDLDRRVRRYLVAAGRKGDLSGFVEETLRARLLEIAMKSVPSSPGFARSANDVEPAPGNPSFEDELLDSGDERYGR
jgi:hypothetical protein